MSDIIHISSRLNENNNQDPLVTFKINGILCFFTNDIDCHDCGDECYWRVVPKIRLRPLQYSFFSEYFGDVSVYEIPRQITRFGDEHSILFGKKFISEHIAFELYPFLQGQELTLKELGLDEENYVTVNNLEEEGVIGWTHNLSLKIEHNKDDVLEYQILKNGELFSGFCDPSSSFQLGDGSSVVYIYENRIIVENCGDVSSVVVIKYII